MSDLTPKVETTTPEPAQVPVKNVAEGEVDYKAMTEKLTKELGQAQHKIINLKREDKKPTETPAPIIEPPTEEFLDVETFKAEVREESRQEIEKFKQDQMKTVLEHQLEAMSSNPDEREAIRAYYDSRLVKTGTTSEAIAHDLVNARLLANRPRFEKTMSEMKQTIHSNNVTSAGTTTGQPLPTEDPSTLSQAEEAWVKAVAIRTGKPEAEIRTKLIQNKKR